MPYTIPRTSDPSGTADAVATLAGNWMGRLVDGRGVAESFNLQHDDARQQLPGQIHVFSTPAGVVAAARLLEASERSFVFLVGPYHDAGIQAPVVTVLEGTYEAGSMDGTFQTWRHGERRCVRAGRFAATQVTQVNRAA